MRRLGRWGAALAALLLAAEPSWASLGTSGFHAVGVAHSAYPISAIAVAPDGRLFAAVQALGQTLGATPGTAEIRVYSAYATNDGSVLDEGAVWATVPGVRATNNEEGLLGIALAPDFATSGLVYVYLTTTDDDLDQQVWAYRENAGGTGDFAGKVLTAVEPPIESPNRNGAALAFGADGCLYLGVGDNGSANRWNAQVLIGTNPIQAPENTAFCSSVCLGPTEYPDRTVPANDGAPNQAGKMLRFAVEGASAAQGGQGNRLAAQPFVFSAGFRNPLGIGVHPLTGQMFVAEKGDSDRGQIHLIEAGSNHGWPCLEGDIVATNAACLAGKTPADVYASHPDWRPPLTAHGTSPVPASPAVYTGLAYPAQYYGDLFYLLRQSDRIYRVDLEPPCFLPDPNGVTPIAFHDEPSDGDFVVTYDRDGDGQADDVSFPTLMSLTQGPDPLGRQALYVAGVQANSSALTDDAVVFRIEFGLALTPYSGPAGRVADACFAGSPYENPFARPSCLPPGGPCPGQPDGTACGDTGLCDGVEACSGGICRHGAPATDGTACPARDACHDGFTCQAGYCTEGPAAPDGTACPDADPCNGLETCRAGACTPGNGPEPLGVRALTVRRETRGPGSGSLTLSGSITPAIPLAPDTTDALTLELRDGADVVFSATLDHPASDPFWKRRKRLLRYGNRRASGSLTTVVLRARKNGSTTVGIEGKRLAFTGLDETTMRPKLVIGDQCFVGDLGRRCFLDAKKLRCR